MLPEKFEEPAGFQWGNFTNTKGAQIRYGSLQPEGAVKGTMVIVTGFRETIEKYFEVAREMAAKGAEIFEYHLWSDHNFGRLMELVGYEERRITFSKFARKE